MEFWTILYCAPCKICSIGHYDFPFRLLFIFSYFSDMVDVYYGNSIHGPFTTTWPRCSQETNLRKLLFFVMDPSSEQTMGRGTLLRNVPLFHYQTGLAYAWHIYFAVVAQFHPVVFPIASPWYIPYHGLVTTQPLLSENIAHGNCRDKALSGTTTVI